MKEDCKLKIELVDKLCKERGLPAESTVVTAENVLNMFGDSGKGYHGGDYNGFSCC